MSLHSTYFSAEGFNPLPRLERLAHPYRHRTVVSLRGAPLDVAWTARAARELGRRTIPLRVEMQLYFACVVKKRVLFGDAVEGEGIDTDGVARLVFRVVEASACDPVEFAANYPARRELDSPAARKMHPRELLLDFRRGTWQGEFSV